jgi:thymidylate synthase
MIEYLKLLRYVLDNGEVKKSRAVLATGDKPDTLGVFGYHYRINLADGFPLLTTKEMSIGKIAAELIWFLRGDTNVKYLHENGVKIWDQWADEEGELGPIYGKQWRRWEGPDGIVVDQIEDVIEGIRQVISDPQDSAARRLVVTAWNPGDAKKAARDETRVYGPMGCHTLFQFNVHGDRLSCHLYQRSADLFLGVPWNIASYAMLTHLIAKITGLKPGDFVHSFGDAHIYENHLPQVKEQLSRVPYALPRLEIDSLVTSVNGLSPDQFHLVDYRSHSRLSGEVAV